MSIMFRTLILPLTLILLASPALAEPPGHAKKADGAQSAKDYAPGHNKDGKDKDKYKDDGDREYNCGDIKGDDARKRCREAKRDRNDKDREVDCGDIKGDDARKRCREAKSSRNDKHSGKEECDNVQGDLARKACLDKYQNKNKEKR